MYLSALAAIMWKLAGAAVAILLLTTKESKDLLCGRLGRPPPPELDRSAKAAKPLRPNKVDRSRGSASCDSAVPASPGVPSPTASVATPPEVQLVIVTHLPLSNPPNASASPVTGAGASVTATPTSTPSAESVHLPPV